MKTLFSAIACAAFCALPVICSAASIFYNISGVSKDLSVTYSVVDSATVKKVSTTIKLTKGVVSPWYGAFEVDDVSNIVNIDSIYATYKDAAIGSDKDGDLTIFNAAYYDGAVLNLSNGASGISEWWMWYPTDDYIVNHAGKGRQLGMYGACRVTITVSRGSKGVVKLSNMVPSGCVFYNYSSGGFGNFSTVDWFNKPVTRMDGAVRTAPTMNLILW